MAQKWSILSNFAEWFGVKNLDFDQRLSCM